jgi:hypothetical protein
MAVRDYSKYGVVTSNTTIPTTNNKPKQTVSPTFVPTTNNKPKQTVSPTFVPTTYNPAPAKSTGLTAGPLTQAARAAQAEAASSTYTYNPLDADFKMPDTTVKPNTNPDYGIQYRDSNQYPGTPNVVENKTAQPDYMQYLINMVKNQFKYNATSEINALRQAYEQGRRQLQGQLPGIDQNARSAYDANDAYYYTQALPELRAAMEQAGLYKGGDMLGGNVNLLTMRGQNAGQISQDKMNQVNAIQQAIAQLNAEEPLKIAEIEAANNAAEAQALLDAINTGIQNNIAVAGVTGEYGGKLTPAGQLTQQEILKNEAATIAAANYDNIAGYINTLDPNDPLIPYLNAERQGKIQKQAEEQAARAAAASAAEKARYEQAFEMWKTYGVATAEIASILGVPVGARTADFNIDSINAATSRQNANTAANKTQPNVNLASYINYIESNYGNNKTKIRAYLESLYRQGVDPAIIDALADKYGIR